MLRRVLLILILSCMLTSCGGAPPAPTEAPVESPSVTVEPTQPLIAETPTQAHTSTPLPTNTPLPTSTPAPTSTETPLPTLVLPTEVVNPPVRSVWDGTPTYLGDSASGYAFRVTYDPEVWALTLDQFGYPALGHRTLSGCVISVTSGRGLPPSMNVEHETLEAGDVIFDVATAYENDVKKFVFSSTCATYGEPQNIPIDEQHRQQPENPYGWTKLFVERILKDFDRAYGLKFVALRYFNACGATNRRTEHHDPETHLIPLILDAAAGDRANISVFGSDYPTPDGTAIRDYIHVSDLSQAHLLAVDHLRNGGDSECINLGNGLGFSVLEVIEAARKVTGREIPVVMEGRRPGDPSRLVGDSTKARELLGWNPQLTSLEQIISSAWQWYEQDPRERSAGSN